MSAEKLKGDQSHSREVIWTCKIGGPGFLEGTGNDFPMRQAVEDAYREVVGRDSEFNFSGWAGELDEAERAVVEDREPRYDLTDTGMLDLIETAWGIIANAQGGNWDEASPEWREAAERWRDRYHEW